MWTVWKHLHVLFPQVFPLICHVSIFIITAGSWLYSWADITAVSQLAYSMCSDIKYRSNVWRHYAIQFYRRVCPDFWMVLYAKRNCSASVHTIYHLEWESIISHFAIFTFQLQFSLTSPNFDEVLSPPPLPAQPALYSPSHPNLAFHAHFLSLFCADCSIKSRGTPWWTGG